MADPRLSGGSGCGQRRWAFADCLFDESNWTLTVGGRRVAIESKPLEILRQLLLRPGRVVSKLELLDAIWPGIAVVEASLPTAVHKLRVALGDEAREVPIVETVPRIGYRLAVPVEVEGEGLEAARTVSPPAAPPRGALVRQAALGAVILVSVAVGLGATGPHFFRRPAQAATANPTFQEIDKSLRTLNVEQIDAYLAAGWNPNSKLDKVGSIALTRLLDMCEWDSAHDRRKMLLMARTLIDGGTELTYRNSFGDTAYSIAKAPRFCGPNHPVTVMLHRMCYNGSMGPEDRCLASYELERRKKRRA